jgi:hypothetical protein
MVGVMAIMPDATGREYLVLDCGHLLWSGTLVRRKRSYARVKVLCAQCEHAADA